MQIGHNSSTCEKRNTAIDTVHMSANVESSSAPRNFSGPTLQQPLVVINKTQQSSATTGSRKRNAIATTTPDASTSLGTTASKKHDKKSNRVLKSYANARVYTRISGKAELNLQASVPMSQTSSSVTITMTSGKAQTHVVSLRKGHAEEN